MTGDRTDANELEQLALVPESTPPRKRVSKAKPAIEAAPHLPVAQVAVDTGLSHLDRAFDYLVPTTLDELVVIGCRVKIRFAGRLVDGFVTDRVEGTEHVGQLAYVAKVVSSEPVLHPEVLDLARAVAERYAGTLADVLRLAIPPRHARAEAAVRAIAATDLNDVDATIWKSHAHGSEFLAALRSGNNPRAWWSALPGQDPARAVAQAVLATCTAAEGRSCACRTYAMSHVGTRPLPRYWAKDTTSC